MTKKHAVYTGVENHQCAPAPEPPVNNRIRDAIPSEANSANAYPYSRERMGDVLSSFCCVLELISRDQGCMRRPPEIEIIRKAYELWEQSGKPEGRDQEFYLQALHELQTLPDNNAPGEDE
jgi:hypothetical protein